MGEEEEGEKDEETEEEEEETRRKLKHLWRLAFWAKAMEWRL